MDSFPYDDEIGITELAPDREFLLSPDGLSALALPFHPSGFAWPATTRRRAAFGCLREGGFDEDFAWTPGKLEAGFLQLIECHLERSTFDDEVAHLVANFLATWLARFTGVEADLLHQLAPLLVVVSTTTRLPGFTLELMNHLVHKG